MQAKANTMPSKQKQMQMKIPREKFYSNESWKNVTTESIDLRVLIKQEFKKNKKICRTIKMEKLYILTY